MQPRDGTSEEKNSKNNTDQWEDKELGADENFAQRTPAEREQRLNQLIDNALELELISIRLQKGLIEAFKELADLEGIGYQPLMRNVLTRYIRERAEQ